MFKDIAKMIRPVPEPYHIYKTIKGTEHELVRGASARMWAEMFPRDTFVGLRWATHTLDHLAKVAYITPEGETLCAHCANAPHIIMRTIDPADEKYRVVDVDIIDDGQVYRCAYCGHDDVGASKAED